MREPFTLSTGQQVWLEVISTTEVDVQVSKIEMNQDPGTLRRSPVLRQTLKEAGDIYTDIIESTKSLAMI
jgi:hypothetical protein